MTTNPPDLPSTVEATLSVCPRFRTGGGKCKISSQISRSTLSLPHTGVGKSSLISSVFNVDIKDIDIAHDRAGKANIAREYTSDTISRFILHDSQGFEPGSLEKWEVVENFIRDKCNETLPSKARLHAIWLCIETPRTGSRMQTADEKLLNLANNFKVAVIIVFTKYDILVNEYHRKATRSLPKLAKADISRTVETNAKDHLNKLIEGFQQRLDFVSLDQRKIHEAFPHAKRGDRNHSRIFA